MYGSTISDTSGFIRDYAYNFLIAAYLKATLEEMYHADLLFHVSQSAVLNSSNK